ncbi:MAG: MFS transporter [Spirochaetaceae bacterium]|nr:MFS transporter [Spirochaetaceae bacterium]
MDKKKFNIPSVITIAASHFFHDVYSYFLPPALPIIKEALKISYSQAGMLSIFQRFPAILNPFIGGFISKKPSSLVIALSIFATAISMCFITAAPSYIVLSLLILIMGLSSCFYHIPAPVMIRKYAGDKTGTGMSFYMAGGELARAAAPFVILGAIFLFGITKVYYLIPFAAIFGLLFIFKFKKDENWNFNTKDTDSQKKDELEEPFLKVIGRMKLFFFTIFMIMMAKASIAATLNAFLPVYLTSTGSSLWFSGISLSVLQVAGAAGTILAGPVSDRFGKNNTLLVSTFLSPILMFLFLFLDSSFLMITIILTGFIAFSPAPVAMAYVQEASGKNHTVCSSIYMMIDFSTIAISIILTGILGDFFNLKTAFVCCGIISCFGFPFVLLLRKSKCVHIK